MNVYDLFPSRYVAAVDLNGKHVTVTIEKVIKEQMGKPPNEEIKPVVYFKGAQKGMVLNKTNAMSITDLYGPETDAWAGKKIVIYPARVKAFGSMQDAIRVKPPQGNHDDGHRIPPPPPDFDEPDLDYTEPDPTGAPPEPEPTDDNPFDDRVDAEGYDIIAGWQLDPEAAKQWAVDVAACANIHEARNSLAKIVNEQHGGKLNKDNVGEVLVDFYLHQVEKMEALAA